MVKARSFRKKNRSKKEQIPLLIFISLQMQGDVAQFKAKGMTQSGLVSSTIKSSVPKNFRTTHWVGVAKRARIIYYSPERVSGAELSGSYL